MKNKKTHYAWWIMISFCVIQCSCLGLISNCRGIFYRPVCDAMGFELGEFTFCTTLYAIGSCAVLPFVGIILRKYNVRAVLSIAVVVLAATVALMGTFRSIEQWYIDSLFQGAAAAFLALVPAPIILSNWFYKKRGTAIAISASASGITGMVMNPIGAVIIEKFGWSAGYYAFALFLLIVTLPFTVFVVRYQPSDMGLKAYGQEDAPQDTAAEQSGVSAKAALKMPSFWCTAVMAGLMCICTCISQFFPGFAGTLGLGAVTGAAMVSVAMGGNIGGKILLGCLNDKLGVRKATSLGTLLVAAGLLLLLFSKDFTWLMVGAFLSGISMSIHAVLVPIATRSIFGGRDYGIIYSYMVMSSTILSSIGTVIIGCLYDLTAGYEVSFLFILMDALLAVAMLYGAFRLRSRGSADAV